MIVGIDGSNIRTGGGLTHLSKLLAVAQPQAHGISEIRLWASSHCLAQLPSRPDVEFSHEPMLDRALPWRLYWQMARLPALARACDVLFVPGGNAPNRISPMVTMCRNMLPFEWKELSRYGFSPTALRLLLLWLGQSRSFRRAEGLICLTRYAHDVVLRSVRLGGQVRIIPHGVDERFRAPPRPQRELASCTERDPFRLLYVSIIDVYKHQWHVAEAVAALRDAGLPVSIDFVGPAYPAALPRFDAVVRRLDPAGAFLRYRGPIPYAKLHELRHEADAFVFASSCENMPNILVEAMASGFPIACAECGPMPEILGDGGVYFEPESAASIAAALETLVRDASLRAELAERAFERARAFSWERCARETLDLIVDVARQSGALAATSAPPDARLDG